MTRARVCGMLLHVTSLPSPGGIGTLGKAAYDFVDFLARSGMTIWQTLPVGPTGFGDSPYQSISTYAGEPMLIDLQTLVEEGLLDAVPDAEVGDPRRVDYDAARARADTALRRAFAQSRNKMKAEVEAFRASHAWADDFALFSALKRRFGGVMWTQWPDRALRDREPAAIAQAKAELADEIAYGLYVQTLFERQWQKLKAYAAAHGVLLFGDMPIYVAEDSADTWANRDAFQLDADGRPTSVAGVPPDYFCADGQRWGNPLYRWDRMRKSGYRWWIDRLRAAGTRFDLVRVDHFIGFANYYSVPAAEKTARVGRWVIGPGWRLFHAVKRALPGLRIIAEDLGVVSWRVKLLLRYCGYPGMRVLLFAFGASDKNRHLPSAYPRNCIVYTGTHDNDTVRGWWERIDERERDAARAYLGDTTDIADSMIRAALGSRADTAIVPLQDFLGLGNEARMNRPGTVGGNWGWRAVPEDLTPALSTRIAALVAESQRGKTV